MSAHWIYISPHLDDAVYSCGGLISQQVRKGEKVAVWTLFAGDPTLDQMTPYAQSLHQRWGAGLDAAALRRTEDRTACDLLGAEPRHFHWLDCIYRTIKGAPLVKSDEELFSPNTPLQDDLVDEIVATLREQLPPKAKLVVPLAAGNHIDHRVVRAAAEKLVIRPLYYADVPYVMGHPEEIARLTTAMKPGLTESLSPDAIQKWITAMAAYKSQMSTFWTSIDTLQQQVETYLGQNNHFHLWNN